MVVLPTCHVICRQKIIMTLWSQECGPYIQGGAIQVLFFSIPTFTIMTSSFYIIYLIFMYLGSPFVAQNNHFFFGTFTPISFS